MSKNKKVSEINEKLSRAYFFLEEVEGQIRGLEGLREETLRKIDDYKEEIIGIDGKIKQEKINKLECKIKCFYYKDPSKCKKWDKSKCPYTKQFKLAPFIKGEKKT
ncbi:MAG: hypothetical protein ACTSRI_02835 [Promethearchaeota archaeon]